MLDTALGLGVIWRSRRTMQFTVLQPFWQKIRNVVQTIITEQTQLVDDINLVKTERLQGEVNRLDCALYPYTSPKLQFSWDIAVQYSTKQ